MLTQKQDEFCVAYVEGSNASEAYRQAYSADGMSDNAVYVEASRLLDNPKIALRIAEIREPAVKSAQITLEAHLNDLRELRDKAEQAEKYGPAIQAEIARGKASGLYVEKTEVTGKDGAPLLTGIEVTFVKANG